MRREIAISVLCGGLAACAVPPMGSPPRASYHPPPVASASAPHDLQSARRACNEAYPPQIGNFLSHANCVNTAVENFALPTARYPDLVRLQEQARVQISTRIDQQAISAHDGEQQMATADKAITAAEHERDAARPEAADEQLARVDALLRD